MKPTPVEQANRMRISCDVLKCFAANTWLTFQQGYVTVNWRDSRGLFERRWMTRGQDFYPVWHRSWGRGGTASTALSQLVRWIRGKPVLPLATWRVWMGEGYRLGGDRGDEALRLLEDAEWPATVNCVLCNGELTGSLAWWSLRKVTGPCCSLRNGCRQQRPSVASARLLRRGDADLS